MTQAIMQRNNSFSAAQWRVFDTPVPYPDAVAMMETHVESMIAGNAGDVVWCMEHPACYTAGTSAKAADLLDARFPVYETGRGGEYTYHGPGQLVVYPIIDLKRAMDEQPDLRAYIWQLEQLVIDTIAQFGITGERRAGRVGIWVAQPSSSSSVIPVPPLIPAPPVIPAKAGIHTAPTMPAGESKIAAIGVRVRKWVAFHGFALNITPNLMDFTGIVPCGLHGFGVTSMQAQLGDRCPTREDVIEKLRQVIEID